MRTTRRDRNMVQRPCYGHELLLRHHRRLQIPVCLLTAIQSMEKIWPVDLVYHVWKERSCGLTRKVCILHQEDLDSLAKLVISHRWSGKTRFRWDAVFAAVLLETFLCANTTQLEM